MDYSHCVRVLVAPAIAFVTITTAADVRSSEIAPWLPCFADLVTKSELNSEQPELAAFLVASPDGPSCVRWPEGRSHSASFYGVVPEGTFAIVHTHPHPLEEPSRDDVRTARSLNLPIYVVSRKSIWVTNPESMRGTPLIRRTNWRKKLNLHAP